MPSPNKDIVQDIVEQAAIDGDQTKPLDIQTIQESSKDKINGDIGTNTTSPALKISPL